MAKFNTRIRSIIEGLSDFWLIFFKEVDQLDVFYKGTEILIGQAYLDMLSLLLNNSVQDTVLFNREFFKLIQIRESELLFKEGTATENNRYVYTLEDDVADLNYLNNKILSVTASLGKNTDFFVDRETRKLNFLFDPTNAYLQRTFGTGNSAFTLRTQISNTLIRVNLNDNGTLVPTLSRVGDGLDILIDYDGPANTGTVTTNILIAAINTHPEVSGLLLATLNGPSKGTGSPIGTGGLVDLLKVAVNPLNNYAVRNITSTFSSTFTVNGITDWTAQGVEKGDTLRLLSGSNIGSPVEHTISLIRKTALYTDAGVTIDRDPGTNMAYAILRTPADPVSSNEPISHSGEIQQTGTDGVINSITREFSSATASFSPVHVGDLIELAGPLNITTGVILSVIDPNTVVLATPGLINDSGVTWRFRSVIPNNNFASIGQLFNNGDGTGRLNSAVGNFIEARSDGTILYIYRGGIREQYEVLYQSGPFDLFIKMDPSVPPQASGVVWGHAYLRANVTSLVFSPPTAWPTAESVSVNARRLWDDAAVKVGRDYEVNADLGTIRPITVWKTSINNTATYSYRFAVDTSVSPQQAGVDGTLTVGPPDTFSSPIALFNSTHVGQALVITNSSVAAGGTNNGTYLIAAITSPTTVQLTSDRALNVTADLNNGFLVWKLQYRGVQATENVSTLEQEMAFWAPDTLIDKYHLYNTYGYLIGRFAQSSEEYRSLIRGVFQLFMLGPTLERFESAINTVAGLDVIRDNGELLLDYTADILQAGTDGLFNFSTKTFSAASASFTPTDVGKFIFSVTGVNANITFEIFQVLDANTAVLTSPPITEATSSSWELSATLEHSVRTSLRTYTFPRNIPIRKPLTTPANFGVTILEEFEVITDAFKVTDYVESPTWWKEIQIPVELMPDEGSARRQSSPKLFENVVNPSDDGRIGDPGFRIGSNSDGFAPESVYLYDDGGASDGLLVPDPLFPFSAIHYFETTVNTLFSDTDLGNLIVLYPPPGNPVSYRITAVISNSRVQIESFLPIDPPLTSLYWEVHGQPVPVRHKMAFIVLDKFLKQHLFSVTFDASLLTQISTSLISDLQELVFIAKPSYTYLVLRPSTFFQDPLRVTELPLQITSTP